MSIILKSGSLSLLQPSEPVQACNGIYFTFYLKTMHHKSAIKFHTECPQILVTTLQNPVAYATWYPGL
jgi:hypothetical protein